MLLAVVCLFTVLAIRLVQIQWCSHKTFSSQAESQQTRRVVLPARRGRIYDRNLQLLATSTPSPSVFVDPKHVKNLSRLAAALADALSLDAGRLYERLRANAKGRFVWVKRRLGAQEYAAFQAVDRDALSGVGVIWEEKRRYPLGRLACHVLGFVDVDGEGRGGVEQVFQDRLAGQPGTVALALDGLGRRRVVRPEPDTDARHGASLVLTLDAAIQQIAQEEVERGALEHEPQSATVVVLQVDTGEVLALANAPAFDPNAPGAAPPRHLLNCATQARYEPGSTFKPFILSAALQENVVALDDRLFCYNGVYRTGRRVLHDHHPYGWLTTAQIVIKSSNIGIARIGEALGRDRMCGYLERFGFAQPTGIELPGELRGKVTPPERWSYYTTTSVPMGHEVAITPLRLAVAFNALANDGVMVAPTLAKAVVDDHFHMIDAPAAPGRQRVLSRDTAQAMLHDVLARVVEEGTGKRARLDRWRLGGKTGTAQKVLDDGTYSHSLYVSSFVCVAPVEAPLVTILVMFDGPTKGHSFYGGVVAAPVAARIASRVLEYLDVAPSAELADLERRGTDVRRWRAGVFEGRRTDERG